MLFYLSKLNIFSFIYAKFDQNLVKNFHNAIVCRMQWYEKLLKIKTSKIKKILHTYIINMPVNIFLSFHCILIHANQTFL